MSLPLSSTVMEKMRSRHNAEENQNSEQEEIDTESREDNNTSSGNSTKCRIDGLLKHFLFLVLMEDCPERLELNDLQTKIEELQSRRYYLCQTGGSERTTGPGASSCSVDTQAPEQSSGTRDVKDSEEDRGTEEERKFVERRENILDTLFKTAIDAILPIANDATMVSERENFARSFTETKQYPHHAYVRMCNKALALLASLQSQANLPFREQDTLNIRFHRNYPKTIDSKGSNQNSRHFPRVVITSLAALRADGLQNEVKVAKDQSAIIPETVLRWDAVLSAIEFKRKLKKHRLKDQQADEEKDNPCPVMKSALNLSDVKRPRDDEDSEDNASPKKTARYLDPESRGTKGKGSKTASLNVNERLNKPSPETRDAEPNGGARCASYALEMFSYSAGVHHVVNLLFIDSNVWVWYYDRQGTLRSDCLCIFANFSHFLVLLFALQRFNLQDWGIVSCLNPEALRAHDLQSTEQDGGNFILNVRQNPSLWKSQVLDDDLATVEVNMSEFLCFDSYRLSGRATAVVSAVGFAADGSRLPTPLVCKIAHPELQWRHEGATIHVIRQMAVDNDVDMLKHLPTLMFYGDVRGSSTQRIRSMVGRTWKGHRSLRIIVMKKLEKITTVQGAEFIKAWLDTVICHAFLWKHYVEHGDPSLNNIMYDPETRCGVLCDYDLSHLQWEPRVIGTEGGGTVPFMAINLLHKNYWEGKIQRYYHHELESFIWILTYVVLLYKDGKRQPNRFVDPWRTSDHERCREKKVAFYLNDTLAEAGNSVRQPYKEFWILVESLCYTMHHCHGQSFPKSPPVSEFTRIKELIIQQMDPDLKGDILKKLEAIVDEDPDGLRNPQIYKSEPLWRSTILWGKFKNTLSQTDFTLLSQDEADTFQHQLARLVGVKPSFQPPDEDTVRRLRETYGTILDQAPSVFEP